MAATDARFMSLALAEARLAATEGEVPVGAVLVDGQGEVIGADHNRREQLSDATAHAEMLVIAAAGTARGDWRLPDTTLYVTLEPCPMCAGAAINARIGTIVYGTADPKAGAAWSLYNIPQDARLNHRCEIRHGVLAEESADLLATFFRDQR
ncbi:MAG TPA: tRNA adenosine(34) deaminase TadA [Acidimicrobiia bacterium]|nr:tRNA adenosine(34) deaminase TadA [Acidimicrobiia bacterium]